jgi:hypothetical protein
VKLEKNNFDCKLLIRLADMLRKTVGVSQLERTSYEGKLSKKRDKLEGPEGEARLGDEGPGATFRES